MRTAITHAHVVVGNGRTIDDGLVIVNGDRIERVAPNDSATDGSFDLVVDLEGRMLVAGPGVWPTGGSGAHLERGVGIDSAADARRRVRELVERGVDVIKIVSADGPPGVDAGTTVYPTEDEIVVTFAEA